MWKSQKIELLKKINNVKFRDAELKLSYFQVTKCRLKFRQIVLRSK